MLLDIEKGDNTYNSYLLIVTLNRFPHLYSQVLLIFQATINTALPLLVLGTVGIIGGVLALFLPETMDKELPQTLADGESFGQDQKFFDIPCCQR